MSSDVTASFPRSLSHRQHSSFTYWSLSRKIPGQRDADAFKKDYSNPAQSPEQVLRPKLRGVDLDLEI